MKNKSTSLCLFGYDPVLVKNEDEWVEFDSIFNSKTKNSSYRPTVGQSSIFWRSLVRRQWQYDDFKFGYLAAAEYIPSAHRYKIHFNPFEMYKAGMCWEAGIGRNTEDPNLLRQLEDEAWKDALKNGHFKCQETHMTMESFGWDHKVAISLQESYDKGEWTDEGWKLWTNLISRNIHLSHNLVAVMMHEVQHIISQHLVRLKGKNKKLWNIATDFAINQHVPFSTNWARNLITLKNPSFEKNMNGCICKWLCITNDDIRKEMKEKYDVDYHSDLEIFALKSSELKEFLYDGVFRNHKYLNKSADFYYDVYKESGESEVSKVMSETGGNHDDWEKGLQSEDDIDVDKESQSDTGSDKEKNSEEKIEDGEETDTSNEKDKSEKEGGKSHPGFNESVARNEAKNGVRKALESCGYKCDSQEDIEKALKNIPNIGGIGSVIKEWFGVKKVNWKRKLSTELKWSMNATSREFTMKREHRAVDGVFPGKTLHLGLEIIIGLDTSGSIQYSDWNDFANQVYYIAKDCDVLKTRVIQCHSHISFDQYIKLKKIKMMGVKEVGGTRMKEIADKLKSEKNRKTLVLFTDGAIDHFKQKDYAFKIIMFLSRGNSFYKESLEKRGFKVICQDEE